MDKEIRATRSTSTVQVMKFMLSLRRCILDILEVFVIHKP
jgi:hypothetical protein